MSDLPTGWTDRRLGDAGGLCARRIDGYPGVKPYLATSDVNRGVATPSGAFTHAGRPARADLLLKTNDVLQAKMKGTDKAFHVGDIQNGWLASTGFAQFDPRAVGNSSRFFLHVLSSRRFLEAKDARCVGSTQQAISDKELAGIVVALPPHAEQIGIADVLDVIDATLHETEALIAKLKAVRKGLLHDLLTRGLDANGELRPPQAKAPHLYKESPLGWIPKEWEVGSVATMTDILDNQRVPVNEAERSRRPGDVPYYGANGQQGWIDRQLFNEPLILLAEDGGNFDDFASRPIAYRIEGPSWVNNHAHILKAKASCSQTFIFFALVHRDIRRYVSGGTRAKLTAKELRSIELPCPSQNEQAAIAQRLEAIETRLRYELQYREKLTQEKAGLMDDLLTGRVRVTPLLAETAQQSGCA